MIKSRSVYWFDANSIISRDLITIIEKITFMWHDQESQCLLVWR